LQREAMD